MKIIMASQQKKENQQQSIPLVFCGVAQPVQGGKKLDFDKTLNAINAQDQGTRRKAKK